MKIHHFLLVAALGTGAIGLAQAATTAPADPTATPRIDKRQANQQKRIDQGIASGNLTQKEADRLKTEQARNARAEERAKADGVVTKKERARLNARENRSSKHIARQKHDRQKVAPST